MDITHNLTIKASAETIYNAVATEKGINGWWSKDCNVGENEGEDSLLKFDKQGTIVEMSFRTETLIPNQKAVWICTKNGNPLWLNTKIVTEITETTDGAEIVFSHANFQDGLEDNEGFEMTKQGWQHFVGSLQSFCETGEGQPW
jgi:uncharacterized protein YndB with AHSA1/START domain